MIKEDDIVRYRVMERMRTLAIEDPYFAYNFGYTPGRANRAKREISEYLDGIKDPARREAMFRYIVEGKNAEESAYYGSLKGTRETRKSLQCFVESEVLDSSKCSQHVKDMKKRDPVRAALLERVYKMM